MDIKEVKPGIKANWFKTADSRTGAAPRIISVIILRAAGTKRVAVKTQENGLSRIRYAGLDCLEKEKICPIPPA
jgi:hypothetical protein